MRRTVFVTGRQKAAMKSMALVWREWEGEKYAERKARGTSTKGVRIGERTLVSCGREGREGGKEGREGGGGREGGREAGRREGGGGWERGRKGGRGRQEGGRKGGREGGGREGERDGRRVNESQLLPLESSSLLTSY